MKRSDLAYIMKNSAGGSEKIFEEKLAQVKQYLHFRVNDRDFARRILSHFATSWRESGRMFEENRSLSNNYVKDSASLSCSMVDVATVILG